MPLVDSSVPPVMVGGSAAAYDNPLSGPTGAGGLVLLLADMRTAYLLLNEVRYGAFRLLFGVSRDQANLATLVAALLLAQAMHDKAQRLMIGPAFPSLPNSLFGVSAIEEMLSEIAGPASRKVPSSAALLALAVAVGAVRPGVVKSLHAVRASAHKLDVDFHHRYGYLVDPGHWRRRRAARRSDNGRSDQPPDAGSSAM